MSFVAVSAVTTVVGVGLSAASAAGAFNGEVDKQGPTAEELKTAEQSKKVFEFGEKLRRPVDKMARKELPTLKSSAQLDRLEGEARNEVMAAADPARRQAGLTTAQRGGGPGSGAWFAQQGTAGALTDAALREAGGAGRVSGVQDYLTRAGTFLGRNSSDLESGLNLMTQGAGQSAQSQQDRISAQIGQNQARSAAMGALGGSLMSVGMAGLGGMGGAVKPAAGVASKGVSIMKPPTVTPGSPWSFESQFPQRVGA